MFNVTVERVVTKEVVTELETKVEYLKNKDYVSCK
nr:MAG TPA: hypothetical protein [Caudoviricetes sp.]